MTRQFENWIFTLFTTPWDIALEANDMKLYQLLRSTLEPKEFQYQLEKAPSTGTLHYQGYIRVPRCTFTKIQQLMTAASCRFDHLDAMRGTVGHSVMYTAKATSRVRGPWSYSKETVALTPAKRKMTPMKQVLWICGPPNTGKSYYMTLIFSYLFGDVYKFPARAKTSAGRWLGDYQGQPFVVIDEFNDKDFGPDELKMLLDRGEQTIPRKMGGDSIQFAPDFILLLSNHVREKACQLVYRNPALATRIRACWTDFALFESDINAPEITFI